MKKTVRSIFTGILTLCLLLALFPAIGFADDGGDAQRWNIMLVIDCSDSLNQTPGSKKAVSGSDPDGLRFDAVDSFIDTLQNNGHYVGAILFRANMSSDTSDQAMLSGIKLNTWENGPVALEGNKENLKSQIRTTTTNGASEYVAETDIGTAMLVAEQACEQATKENGLPSAIFLFTDGQIACQVPAVTAKAKENMDKAVDLCAKNGIKVCGVYLDCDDSSAAASEWFRNKIASANGISANSTSKYFIEIDDANDIQNAIDNFLSLLGYSLPNAQIISEGSADFDFRIPGVGVDEVTIRLKSVDGSDLPQNLVVTMTKPDGSDYEVEQRTTMGNNYEVIKIYKEDLMTGRWHVHVELPDDCKVAMVYQPIFSTSFNCDFELTNADESNLMSGMVVDARAYIEINGVEQTGSAAYSEYTCNLVLVNDETGDTKEFPLQLNGNGEVTGTVDLTGIYGTYNVYAEFSCDEISKASPLHRWDLADHTPTAADVNVNGSYGFLCPSEKTVKLPVNDDEDGENLTVTIYTNDCDPDAVTIDGVNLIIKNAKVGNGDITYRVTDSQGAYAEAQLHVKMTNGTLRNILLVILAIAIILFIIWWILTHRVTPPTESECSVKFKMEGDNSRWGETDTELDLKLVPPGRSGKFSDSLYGMLKTDLTNSCGEIQTVCMQKNIDVAAVEKIIAANAAALKSVKLKCVPSTINDEGKKRKVAKIRVKGNGTNTVLYDESVDVQVGAALWNIGYYTGKINTFGDEANDTFHMERKSSAGVFDTMDSNNGFGGGFGGFGGGFGAGNNSSGTTNTDNSFGGGFGGSSSGSVNTDNSFGGFGDFGNNSTDSSFGGFGGGDSFGGFDSNPPASSGTGYEYNQNNSSNAQQPAAPSNTDELDL